MTNRLDVELLTRLLAVPGSGASPPAPCLRSVDFLVDGVSLFRKLGAGQRDLAGCFMSIAVDGINAKEEKAFLGELPAALPNNRIALFVCALCGDVGCGAISFELAIGGGLARWSRFAFEVDWVVEGEDDATRLDFEPFKDIGPFAFEMASYRSAIRKAVALVS